MAFKNPLNDEDLTRINNAIRDLDDNDELIKRSEMAGIDVAEAKKASMLAKTNLKKLKAAFFAGR